MTFTPSQVRAIKEAREQGQLSPEEIADFEAWEREQAMQQPSPAAPAPPPASAPAPALSMPQRLLQEVLKSGPLEGPRQELLTPDVPAPADPRLSSPWYQRLYQQAVRGGLLIGPPSAPEGMPAEEVQPGDITDEMERQRRNDAWMMRQMASWAPTIIAFAFAPASIAPGAYTGLAALAAEFGPAFQRALVMYFGQNIAERVANQLDPYTKGQPHEMARDQAIGEFAGRLGGRTLDAAGRVIDRGRKAVFGQSEWGKRHGETIRGLGGRVMPGMLSEKSVPQALDWFLHHAPFNVEASRVYQQAEKLLDDELRAIKAAHPGTRVTETTDVLKSQAAARSQPALLDTEPELMRQTLGTRIVQEEARIRGNFQALDQHYLQREIPWHFIKGRLPYVRTAEDLLASPNLGPLLQGPDNMFQSGVNLIKTLEALPDQIPLAQALQNQRAVGGAIDEALAHVAAVREGRIPRSALSDSIQNTLLPALGEVQGDIVEKIGPYLVDLRPAKEHARQLLASYEAGLRVPEASLLGGQAGRQALMEDPHILAARGLLNQENFVLFGDAHQVRSQLLEISRLPGPIIGNTVARQGKEMADLVEAQMRQTGGRLHPSLLPQWEHAGREWARVAEVYNSPLITQFHGMNLDDIMTTLIKNERPNDFKTLRAVLGRDAAGNDIFDLAAETWLTRKIEAAREAAGETGVLNVESLLGDLRSMTRVAERELFPRGLTDLRKQLWQVQHMQEAVQVAQAGTNPLALQKLKTAINDPAKWRDVQSDVISNVMFKGGIDPMSGATAMSGLESIYDMRNVLFDNPAHWKALEDVAHAQRQVQTIIGRHTHWTPAMRFLEHGGMIYGLHLLTQSPKITTGIMLGTTALSYAMTNQKFVRMLAEGLTTPISTTRGMELIGNIIAHLEAEGMLKEVEVSREAAPAASPSNWP